MNREGVKQGYPKNLSDEQLIDEIINCIEKGIQASNTPSESFQEWKFYVDMGQSELMLRIQKDLEKEISELKENNRKAGNWNIGLSICTLILASLTIWTAFQNLYYSKSNQVSDEMWKQQQIETLKTNNEELKEINENLNQIILIQSSDSTSQ